MVKIELTDDEATLLCEIVGKVIRSTEYVSEYDYSAPPERYNHPKIVTVGELLKVLPQDIYDLTRKYMASVQFNRVVDSDITICDVLDTNPLSFDWDRTDEGVDYWVMVHEVCEDALGRIGEDSILAGIPRARFDPIPNSKKPTKTLHVVDCSGRSLTSDELSELFGYPINVLNCNE